ncbi:MAG: TMEM175 family protein [Candidatus Korobacteraceae bacterium]
MMTRTKDPKPTEFRKRGQEVTRIEAFSDVVFGFALTLLVVSLEVPHTFTELLADMRGFLPFAVCFGIFAQVWWLHHNFFRRYGLDDGITATLNFVLLFVMLFYTYPLKFVFTGLFNQFAHQPFHGARGEPWLEPWQGSTMMIVYGLGYATVFLVFVLLHWHALRNRRELELNQFELFDTYTSMIEDGFLASVGIVCAATASLLPPSAGGLAGFIFFLIPIGMTIIGSRRRVARHKLEATRTDRITAT